MIGAATQASDVYLIDSQGLTVAASNWQQPNSFVGQDLSVRPYFTQAMARQSGRYYAVGLSSNKRGYYTIPH